MAVRTFIVLLPLLAATLVRASGDTGDHDSSSSGGDGAATEHHCESDEESTATFWYTLDWDQLCRNMTEAEAKQVMREEGLSEGDISEAMRWGCPAYGCRRHWDLLPECIGSHQEAPDTFHHDEIFWTIGFLTISLLLGAFNRWALPKAVPYTVGLLVEGVVLGVIAEALREDPKCPLGALEADVYDVDRDGAIDRDEWDRYNCFDCVEDSRCRNLVGCGDSCYKFDELDVVFRLTLMDTERINFIAGNNKLEPDELWRPVCNLARDLMNTADMPPHLLLIVFLPILLFESAVSIDIGLLSAQAKSVLLLAFPGVVVASLLTAAFLLGFTEGAPMGSLDFNACWLIGTIVSATDPVAVVALLKELGAPKALGTLIEGESLLNDGSAVVLYTFLESWVTHGNNPPVTDNLFLEFLRVIAQMLVFGVVLGAVFGWVACFCLRRLHNDKVAELSVVMGGSYLLFWLSEVLLLSSAVLAVVTFGLYINQMKGAVSADTMHFIEEVYEAFSHMFNTVIFLIAGVKLGLILVEFQLFILDPGWSVILFFPVSLLLVWLAVTVVRFITVGFFFPLLTRIGVGLTWQQAFIVCWGGLRGAVSLALALALGHEMYSQEKFGGPCYQRADGSLPCRDVPFFALYVTLLVVLSTVVFNGSTVSYFLRWLHITDLTDERKFMLNNATKHLAAETDQLRDKISKDQRFYQNVDWSIVKKSTFNDSMVTQHEVQQIEMAAWREAVHLERSAYFEQLERGELGELAYEALENMLSVIEAKANAKRDIEELKELYRRSSNQIIENFGDVDHAVKSDIFEFFIRARFKFKEHTAWTDRRKAAVRFSALMLQYEMALAWCKAQDHVTHALEGTVLDDSPHNSHGNITRKRSIARLRQLKLEDLQRLTYTHVHDCREKQIKRMQQALRKFSEEPIDKRVIAAVETLQATRITLFSQRELLRHLVAEGELTDLDADKLTATVNKMIKGLYLTPYTRWFGADLDVHDCMNKWAQIANQKERKASVQAIFESGRAGPSNRGTPASKRANSMPVAALTQFLPPESISEAAEAQDGDVHRSSVGV